MQEYESFTISKNCLVLFLLMTSGAAQSSGLYPGIYPKDTNSPAPVNTDEVQSNSDGDRTDGHEINPKTLMQKNPGDGPPLIPLPEIDWKAKPQCVTPDGTVYQYKDKKYNSCIMSEQYWCENKKGQKLAKNSPRFRECVDERDRERIEKARLREQRRFEKKLNELNPL